jgi:hypothetical protein
MYIYIHTILYYTEINLHMIYVPEPLCPTLGSMQPLWALLSMELWWLTTSALMAACPIAKAQVEFGGLTPVVVVAKHPRTQTSLDIFFLNTYHTHTYICNMYIFLYYTIYTHIFKHDLWQSLMTFLATNVLLSVRSESLTETPVPC